MRSMKQIKDAIAKSNKRWEENRDLPKKKITPSWQDTKRFFVGKIKEKF